MRKIKSMRLKTGYTQQFVAYKLGVSQQAVVKWESGLTAPKSSRLLQIAKLYGCDVSDLLDD